MVVEGGEGGQTTAVLVHGTGRYVGGWVGGRGEAEGCVRARMHACVRACMLMRCVRAGVRACVCACVLARGCARVRACVRTWTSK